MHKAETLIADPSLRAERRRLRRDLVQASTGQGLILYQQARCRLSDGTPAGHDVSIRWPDRRHGSRSPTSFLPLAAAAGCAAGIFGWSLLTACTIAARGEGRISVPIAGIPPGPILLDHVVAALRGSGLAPDRLELALPEAETAAIDADGLLALCALRDRGIGVILADFGAFGASLGLFRRLPLTAVKLARIMLSHIPADPEDAAILRAVADAAKGFGLPLIADGIDDETQLAFLAGLGVEFGLGGLFGYPVAHRPSSHRPPPQRPALAPTGLRARSASWPTESRSSAPASPDWPALVS